MFAKFGHVTLLADRSVVNSLSDDFPNQEETKDTRKSCCIEQVTSLKKNATRFERFLEKLIVTHVVKNTPQAQDYPLVGCPEPV